MPDKKAYRDSLKEQIRKLDQQRSAGEEIDYDHRNSMVKKVRALEPDIPYDFDIEQEVYVRGFKRRFKGKVSKHHEDPCTKLVLIKPMDTVYKEVFWYPEELLDRVLTDFEILNDDQYIFNWED
ncbi:hypothetical protein UP17_25305 (plasmid) [Peribacillus simplex]|uniref:hypothetical protein n=1 Tax=Peribacillus simplex TaxID=1478 RepID=UPI00077774CF|nr:hypothetical protein [Peribacillus simplex]AMM95759.1 hypothetical protein UP17_25305 [Peribacillus simplex]